MKSKRPRSLDLSSWSVTSMASGASSHTSSSGSQGTSPTVSRAGSCASDTRSESNTSDSSWSTGQPVMSAQKSEPATLKREATGTGENQKNKAEQVQRTVTTLMGGRGYIQWRATHLEKDRKASTIQQINNSDACFVIWDHKI